MSSTGLDVFDKTLQTTHIWLDELMDVEIGPDRQVAWHVLGAVLRAIRDRIPIGLAVHLGSQLPLLVRGVYYDQWHAPGQTREDPPRSLEEFLGPINEQLSNTRPVNVRNATIAVFQILSRHVNRGQIEKVRDALPEPVRNLWQLSPEAPDVRSRPERYRGDAANKDNRPETQPQRSVQRSQPVPKEEVEMARKYSRGASKDVEKEMHEFKRGKARTGKGGKGGKVKSRKQAIAIGLSKARKKGKRVPRKKAR
jgi:uncharacterized protein (DUF2267 family)